METKRELTMTAADVAKILGVSHVTVTRLCKEGRIRHTKIGGQYRFDPRDIEEYIEASTVQPQPA